MSNIEIEGVMCTYQREIDRLNEVIASIRDDLEEMTQSYQREIERYNGIINELREESKDHQETNEIIEDLKKQNIGPFEAPPKFIDIKIED